MQNKGLKIAIFHLGFFFSGGGERLVIEEAKGLVKAGHQVDIYVPVLDRKKCFPELLKQVKIKSLFPHFPFYYPLRDIISINGAILLTPFLFWKFRSYDIFIGANEPGPLIIWVLSLLIHKPYLVYLAHPTRILYPRKIDQEVGFGRGSFNLFYLLTKILRPLIIYVDKISMKKANAVLVNGKYISQSIQSIYQVKTINCPAGTIPGKKVNFRRCEAGKIKVSGQAINKPYILLTNRHFPQKRFDYMITALPFILNKVDVHLVITGAYTFYTEHLKRLVEQLGLTKKVTFLGLVNEKDLKKLYLNAAVYVYTSPEEDFGMGVIEAMGYGVPAVAWDAGGPATTILHKKTGFLVKTNQIPQFAHAITLLLKDRSLNEQMGNNARKHVLSNYTYSRHVWIINKQLQNIFTSFYAYAS